MATFTPAPLFAQETQPGDACAAGEEGFFRHAADNSPGPGIDGQHFLFCDGANWVSFLRYNDASSGVFLPAPSSAQGDAVFSNSEWSLWLDEGNNEFELKAKKSDGSVISATVGAGGGGGGTSLWVNDSTHISYTSGNAHFLNTGESLPATFDDDGTRMFFYPDKQAFRGGAITNADDAWQDGNIGAYSFAWGRNSEASGDYSTAFGGDNGYYNTASGASSTVFGSRNTASGNYSSAFGYGNTASGASSTALGSNTTASGSGSLALGQLSTASGQYSIANGYYSTASGYYSTALGDNATAGGTVSFAQGRNSEASGPYSKAFGVDVEASGYYSTAFGNEVMAGNGADPGVGNRSIVFGLQTASQATDPRVTGDRSLVIFMDGGVANANSTVDVTASDVFVLQGGKMGIGDLNPSVELAVTGDIEYTGTIADVSDRRLKTDIENLPEGQLEKLLQLEGVSFKMKNNPDAPTEYGFIAQDVQPIYGSVVYERGEDDMLSMNYVGLIAPMVEAIKEQNALIEKQSEHIKSLEARLEALEKAQ